jgi:DNA-binding transcriptional MerR regulator
MSYTVNKLALLAGISVRTLHYYDEIGLLEPSNIAKNGYRYYEEKELIRLQQILFFRELDFPLDEIKGMLDRPGFSVIEALKDHKKLIRIKRKRLDGLIQTIDKTIKRMNNNQKMEDVEMYDAFKDDDVKEYQEEVKNRWGNTDAYKQSMQKVSKMTKAQMEELKKKGREHTQAIADNMQKGIDHPDVQALIKQSHEGVNFFYECNLDMFRNLGQMYVDDPRFSAYYEKFASGLAVFMRDAIVFYCDQK